MAAAVEFDFQTKQQRSIAIEQAHDACRDGRCCWIDLDATQREGARALLEQFHIPPLAIDEVLESKLDARHDVYDECLHIAVTAVTYHAGQLATSHVDIVIGERFVITIRHGTAEFIDCVRRTYQTDFVKFASTLSFLLYEFWDHLIESYVKVAREIEGQVEQVQAQILGQTGDEIFADVARVTRDILSFRKIVLAAREVLHELAMRRSQFVSERTQVFLDNMVGKLERLGSDLTVERETLAEALNLYMGIVTHRTNKVVNRLTVLSLIFLPLTFLCGIYGMNFQHQPEFTWRYGYLFFWLLAVLIAGGLFAFMKVRRWL